MKALASLLLVLSLSCCLAAPVMLVDNGVSRAAIYVAPEVMAPVKVNPYGPHYRAELGQVRLQESVKDLARCLGRMSGAELPVYTRAPQPADKVLPILIGTYADAAFGPFTMKTEFAQGWRLAVSTKGVGMQGETHEAVSYAIYEVLDRLGCRWYLPGEMGECIPQRKTITLPEMDLQQSPRVVTRSIVYGDEAFKRRNRLGGFPYIAGHRLERYVSKELLEQHLDWQAEIGGKRGLHFGEVGYRLCWGNPEVAAAVADGLIAELDKHYVECISISPGDGSNFCECEKCRALDAGDWDPAMQCVSITDRYIHFCNQVAERVAKKYPDVKLGFLAYVQFTRPPVREKLHPMLIPQLAPICYCRAHTYIDETCPSRASIKPLLEGWGKASKHLAMYEYNYHLAEVSAPFPMLKRNIDELPIQYAAGVDMWTPETLTNFESVLPGNYLGIRMTWYPAAKPLAILDEFYPTFYGAAGAQMRDYWQYVDDLWTKSSEHTGCGFGYLNRFLPESTAAMRAKMDAALAACKTAMEYRRVKLAGDSLRQFELFMKMRRDFAAGNFASLEEDSQRWMVRNIAWGDEHQDNYTFSRTSWRPTTVNNSYFKAFYYASYQDADRIARDCEMITKPITPWRYAVDEMKQGEAQGWQAPAFDDAAWKTTDPATESWSTLGIPDYYGAVWYRATVQAPALPAGKKVFLWVSATDGKCKVFVNGQHIPYVNAKGETVAEADGYCRPFSFDVTAALKPSAANQITVIGTRHFLNELGTGGLLGPVLLYREK
ncbi:MAG: DUF4838 domain-containing protein [Armatimonadota bacterium]